MLMIQHRRRREEKTDYNSRLALVKSGKTRVVIRRTLSGVRVQFVEYKPNGDVTVATAASADLKKFGWKVDSGNSSAAYLIGLVAGLRAKAKNVNDAVLDTGLHVSTKGSRIYAALKGVLDAGVKVPHSAEVLPPADRLSGAHISAYAKMLQGDAQKRFSKYFASGVNPQEISKHFEEVKKNIVDAKGVSK